MNIKKRNVVTAIILSIVTLGIYSFWLGIKLKQWKTKHISFIEEQ